MTHPPESPAADRLTPEEFTRRAVGIPWIRWRSDWQGADCFGLVVLYFREVLGIDLGQVPQTDIEAGFLAARGWAECGPEPGSTAWMSWRDGAPQHCGVLLPGGMVLHSERMPARSGSVRVTRLQALLRLYGSDVRFYRYAAC